MSIRSSLLLLRSLDMSRRCERLVAVIVEDFSTNINALSRDEGHLAGISLPDLGSHRSDI